LTPQLTETLAPQSSLPADRRLGTIPTSAPALA